MTFHFQANDFKLKELDNLYCLVVHIKDICLEKEILGTFRTVYAGFR